MRLRHNPSRESLLREWRDKQGLHWRFKHICFAFSLLCCHQVAQKNHLLIHPTLRVKRSIKQSWFTPLQVKIHRQSRHSLLLCVHVKSLSVDQASGVEKTRRGPEGKRKQRHTFHLIKTVSCPVWTEHCFIVTVSSPLRSAAWWPHDLLQRRLKIWTQPLEIALAKWTFFIAATSEGGGGASRRHGAWTTARAFGGTLKSFPYTWGFRTRGIHKYKCLFYQTNAYQTGVIVRRAHNKEGWLVHFVLWTLSSTAEIKNIFTAAVHVSLCKPLPAAVKISWEILLWRLDFMASFVIQHFKRLHEPGNEQNYWKLFSVWSDQKGPDESLLNHLASSQQLETLKRWKSRGFSKKNTTRTDPGPYRRIHSAISQVHTKYMCSYVNDVVACPKVFLKP